jgi:hypothetical protein
MKVSRTGVLSSLGLGILAAIALGPASYAHATEAPDPYNTSSYETPAPSTAPDPEAPPAQVGSVEEYSVDCSLIMTPTITPWTLEPVFDGYAWQWDESLIVYGTPFVGEPWQATPEQVWATGLEVPAPCEPTTTYVLANPTVQGSAICGAATVELANAVTLGYNQVGTATTIDINWGDTQMDNVVIDPNEIVDPIAHTYGEDSGDHVITVHADGVLVWTSPAITSDCDATVIATPTTSTPDNSTPEAAGTLALTGAATDGVPQVALLLTVVGFFGLLLKNITRRPRELGDYLGYFRPLSV